MFIDWLADFFCSTAEYYLCKYGKLSNSIPCGSQQSREEDTPREFGQLFDPQKSSLWHSSLESQSPSSAPHGYSEVQKSSSPTIVT